MQRVRGSAESGQALEVADAWCRGGADREEPPGRVPTALWSLEWGQPPHPCPEKQPELWCAEEAPPALFMRQPGVEGCTQHPSHRGAFLLCPFPHLESGDPHNPKAVVSF